jgi:ArsR family transcriptional regulator, arsenate/arsenite/antimonite-responsive transcriptional repressor / arsenate reductase (thioredoxin)
MKRDEGLSVQTPQAVQCFQALGQPLRLETFRTLAAAGDSGMTAGTIADRVGLTPSQVSFHMKELEGAGLCTSCKEGRYVRYCIYPAVVQDLLEFLLNNCCRGRHDLCAPALDSLQALDSRMSADGQLRVLFVCPENDARSIMAAAILNTLAGDRFVAQSAGTRHATQILPEVVALLERFEHVAVEETPKALSDLATETFDFVFTLSGSVSEADLVETFDGGMTANWRITNPVEASDTDELRAARVAETYRQVRRRVEAFIALPIDQLNQMTLRQRVDEIGQMGEGA